ncbi:GTP-binding protein [Streptomyces sp. JV178]|uniref:GTP-binding protein n=1 Tax=Streptomyces sp. JV178 TaxID=858632 RepID=UPI00269369F6|nr:GTP-binding protein [Streptomyces sp. JV178]
MVGLWSQAGSVARFEPSAVRGGSAGEAQELVFIGAGLRGEALRDALGECLVRDGESEGADGFEDPFPEWETFGVEERCEHEVGEGVGA